MEKDFLVRAHEFEGPFDVLLSLIEKRKMHISDVSLAAITDDYIAYLKEHSSQKIGEQAEFVFIAATLMLIKSRSLLPGFSITKDEQARIEDLGTRLAHYQQIRSLAANLSRQFGAHMMYERGPRVEAVYGFYPPKSAVTPARLLAILTDVINRIPRVHKKIGEAVVQKMISIEKMMGDVVERITRNLRMSFKEFAGKDRMGIIVSFLAVLELAKQGLVVATQESLDSDIKVETNSCGVPRYD